MPHFPSGSPVAATAPTAQAPAAAQVSLAAGREQLVSFAARLAGDGLAIGTAGNLSVRIGDRILITPSGVSYDDLTPAQICEIAAPRVTPDSPAGPADPAQRVASRDAAAAHPPTASSETPMHLAIYQDTQAWAVVHTHSPEVVALSATASELPAIHYAIADLGGPVRVARYRRFGSDDLAREVTAGLAGRQAVLLQNHGAVALGSTLAQAYDRARLLEWLAHVYRLARSLGEPRILSAAELDEVSGHMRRIGYGTAGRQ